MGGADAVAPVPVADRISPAHRLGSSAHRTRISRAGGPARQPGKNDLEEQ